MELTFNTRKKQVGKSWRMDETYIKVKGAWMYLYRAVEKGTKWLMSYSPKGEIKELLICFYLKQFITMIDPLSSILISVEVKNKLSKHTTKEHAPK